MKRFLWALALALSVTGASAGPQPDECAAPDYVVHPDGKLERVGAAVAKNNKLDILVLGTGSSTLAGNGGPASAFPARLEAALKSRFPALAVTVRTDVANRRTAAETMGPLKRDIAERKPDLVVWQTGTVDAMRGIEPQEFSDTLEEGAQMLKEAGIDLVLMNMQYSPRTEAMIAAGAYVDAMRLVSQQDEVPLFDRLALMKHWSETGIFDLTSPDQKQLAERVHGCIGRLLAEAIIETAGLAGKPAKDGH